MLFWASLVHFIAFGLLCPILFFWASSARFITFGLLCPIWAALSHFTLLGILDPFHRFRAPLSHLFFLGRPRPVCFPWASSALFLTSHYHGLLLNSLGFPGPITLFLILEVHGLAINPLLSLFSLLWTCRGPFSLFHIIHCLWFAFSLFPSSFKPIYLLKIYFFISWVCDPLFPLLGLNGFSSQFTNFFFPYYWASSCYWPPLPKWASTLPSFKGIVNDDDVCTLLFFIIPFLVSWFASWKFLMILDFYTGTHFFMSAAIFILISSRFCSSTYSFLRFWGTNTFFFFCFHRICRHFLLQYMHLFLCINATLTLLLLEQHLYCRKWRLW